jgi:hypothetical protein
MTVWRRGTRPAGELTYDDHLHRTRRPLAEPLGQVVHSRMRDECLEIKDFATLLEARVITGDWRHAYNHDRPHSSLHYQAPGGLRCDLHPPAPTLITVDRSTGAGQAQCHCSTWYGRRQPPLRESPMGG